MYLHSVMVCPVDFFLRVMLAEGDNLADAAASHFDQNWAEEPTAPQYCNTKQFCMLANLEPCGLNPEAWILGFLGYIVLGDPDLPLFEIGLCFHHQEEMVFWGFVSILD